MHRHAGSDSALLPLTGDTRLGHHSGCGTAVPAARHAAPLPTEHFPLCQTPQCAAFDARRASPGEGRCQHCCSLLPASSSPQCIGGTRDGSHRDNFALGQSLWQSLTKGPSQTRRSSSKQVALRSLPGGSLAGKGAQPREAAMDVSLTRPCCSVSSFATASSLSSAALMAKSRCRGKTNERRARRALVVQASARGESSFHKLLNDQPVVVMPGCYDALSAVVIEKSGFHAAFISGYATSASKLGFPDFGLLTPTEMCTTARYVCSSVQKIPVIVDADTGGGNALNVQRTVRDLIAAGAAGCFLEDQVWPKKCGHMRGKQVIPAEEHAVKIAAAREAIGDSDFFLVARTDARATSARSGLDDAIARANLYMEAGADASFVEAPRDVEELRAIGKRTKGPRVCNMLEGGVTPLLHPTELAELGFQIIVNPLTGLYAATRALISIHKTLREAGTTREKLAELATFSEFNDLVSLEEWFAAEEKFSPAAFQARRAKAAKEASDVPA